MGDLLAKIYLVPIIVKMEQENFLMSLSRRAAKEEGGIVVGGAGEDQSSRGLSRRVGSSSGSSLQSLVLHIHNSIESRQLTS